MIVLVLAACGNRNTDQTAVQSSSDWAYRFVIWNETRYVLTDTLVDHVTEHIGTVALYADDENMVQTNNFSNYFNQGTKLFKIANIPVETAIAAHMEDGTYVKLESRVNQ